MTQPDYFQTRSDIAQIRAQIARIHMLLPKDHPARDELYESLLAVIRAHSYFVSQMASDQEAELYLRTA